MFFGPSCGVDRANEIRARARRARSGVASTLNPGVPFTFVRARGSMDALLDAEPASLRAALVALDSYGRILGVSPAIAARLGFPRDSLVGRRLSHRLVASARGPFERALRASLGDARIPVPVALRTKRKEVLVAVLAAVGARRFADETVILWSLSFAPSSRAR